MSAEGTSEHPSPDEAIDAGLYYFAREDYVAARRWWEYAMAVDPQNLRAYECLRILGRTVGAVLEARSEPPPPEPGDIAAPLGRMPGEPMPAEPAFEPEIEVDLGSAIGPASEEPEVDVDLGSGIEPAPPPSRPSFGAVPGFDPSTAVSADEALAMEGDALPPDIAAMLATGEGLPPELAVDVAPPAAETPLPEPEKDEGSALDRWTRKSDPPAAVPPPGFEVPGARFSEAPAMNTADLRAGALEFDPLGFDEAWEGIEGGDESSGLEDVVPDVLQAKAPAAEPKAATLEVSPDDPKWQQLMKQIAEGGLVTDAAGIGEAVAAEPGEGALGGEGEPPEELRISLTGDILSTGDLRRAGRPPTGDLPRPTGDLKPRGTGDVRPPTGDVLRSNRPGTGDVRPPTGDVLRSNRPGTGDVRPPTGDVPRSNRPATGDVRPLAAADPRTTGDLRTRERATAIEHRLATGDLRRAPVVLPPDDVGDAGSSSADLRRRSADARTAVELRTAATGDLRKQTGDLRKQTGDLRGPKSRLSAAIPEPRTFAIAAEERVSASTPGLAEPSPEELLGETQRPRPAPGGDFEMIVEDPVDAVVESPGGAAIDYALSAFGSEDAGRVELPSVTQSPWDEGPAESSAVTLPQDSEIEALADYTPAPLLEFPLAEPSIRSSRPVRGTGSIAPRNSINANPDPVAALERARSRLLLHDFDGALALLESIPEAHPVYADAKEVLAETRKQLEASFTSKIGRLDASPRVLMSGQQLIWLNLNHKAGFLLSQIDGNVTFEDLISLAGLSRLDALRILATLVQDGVIQGA